MWTTVKPLGTTPYVWNMDSCFRVSRSWDCHNSVSLRFCVKSMFFVLHSVSAVRNFSLWCMYVWFSNDVDLKSGFRRGWREDQCDRRLVVTKISRSPACFMFAQSSVWSHWHYYCRKESHGSDKFVFTWETSWGQGTYAKDRWRRQEIAFFVFIPLFFWFNTNEDKVQSKNCQRDSLINSEFVLFRSVFNAKRGPVLKRIFSQMGHRRL